MDQPPSTLPETTLEQPPVTLSETVESTPVNIPIIERPLTEPMNGSTCPNVDGWDDTFEWCVPFGGTPMEPDEPNSEKVGEYSQASKDSQDNEDNKDSEDRQDSDNIVNEDNLLDDLEVDMKNFHLNIDKKVEWVGSFPDDQDKTVEGDEELESKRELDFFKNDKNRIRVVCKGTIPNLGILETDGTSKSNDKVGPSQKKKKVKDGSIHKCPWVLLVRDDLGLYANSNFTFISDRHKGAHCDALLNNMCESLNSKIVKGRDKPIISCLEFIMEYIISKIVMVQKEIDKANGPLTPTATKTLQKIKEREVQCRVVFYGNGKYQVTSEGTNQCVVNMEKQKFSCSRWELTGIPNKHSIAAIWDMRLNSENVGKPETWVHLTYWLKTWKETYVFKVEPINGRFCGKKHMSYQVDTTKVLCPYWQTKKKRIRSATEDDGVGFSMHQIHSKTRQRKNQNNDIPKFTYILWIYGFMIIISTLEN
uniref:Zinc finger PMZ-type domain-containing protein n=1 Tax=Lactuca sativa TaxID=4236 RepID=A0A9R1VYL5_LACSA|nr:hypothetical protein LSAT_V11C400172480 [Lactuca sativa]